MIKSENIEQIMSRIPWLILFSFSSVTIQRLHTQGTLLFYIIHIIL